MTKNSDSNFPAHDVDERYYFIIFAWKLFDGPLDLARMQLLSCLFHFNAQK